MLHVGDIGTRVAQALSFALAFAVSAAVLIGFARIVLYPMPEGSGTGVVLEPADQRTMREVWYAPDGADRRYVDDVTGCVTTCRASVEAEFGEICTPETCEAHQ